MEFKSLGEFMNFKITSPRINSQNLYEIVFSSFSLIVTIHLLSNLKLHIPYSYF